MDPQPDSKKDCVLEGTEKDVSDVADGESSVIYIDPKKEAAALAKFDKTVLPVSVIFLILSSLDRNNASSASSPLCMDS